jgi:hypothetical protein
MGHAVTSYDLPHFPTCYCGRVRKVRKQGAEMPGPASRALTYTRGVRTPLCKRGGSYPCKLDNPRAGARGRGQVGDRATIWLGDPTRPPRSPELRFSLDRIRQDGDVPGTLGVQSPVPAVGGFVQLLDNPGHHLVGHDTAAVQPGHDRLQRIPRRPVHIVPRLAANASSGVAAGRGSRKEDRSRIADNQPTGAA